MSNNVVPMNINVPAHVAARMGKPSALATAISGGITAGEGFPRISIRASRFRIVEGGEEYVLNETQLTTVIVGANPNVSKQYYEKPYDGATNADPVAPDCWSLNGIRPHPEAENQQSDLCATCPKNAWGSKISPAGKKTKACADQKRLAIVAAADLQNPDKEPKIYQLQIPPASLRAMNSYYKELVMRGYPPEMTKTVISFDPNASFPQLIFSFGGFMEPHEQEIADKLFELPVIKDITGENQPDVAPSKPAPKAAEPAPQEPVAQPAPAPAPQAEAPAQTSGFGAAPSQPATGGFGGSSSAPQQAAPAPQQAATSQPAAPAPAETDKAQNLSSEITALMAEVGADDD